MNPQVKPGSVGGAFASGLGVALLSVSVASGQNPSPAPASTVAEVEPVIVTGSNIPTAEEVGPNPVDTYRPGDIEKLGVRNSTDLLIKLPQEMGTAVNQNWSGVGDGSVIPNLRGLLPKETLVLIDGKRAAIVGGGGAFSLLANAAGVDTNLILFPMIDHIDILKDGASAIYGSDAVAGVINIFLLHKFRGLEIGGSYGNTNMGASNDAGEREGWLKLARAMTRPISWSLPISTIVLLSTVATATLKVTHSRLGGEGLIFAVRFFPARSQVFAWSRSCFSVRTLRRLTQPPMARLLHFMFTHS
jgi:outer membrane receptor protein involved in Fe transport